MARLMNQGASEEVDAVEVLLDDQGGQDEKAENEQDSAPEQRSTALRLGPDRLGWHEKSRSTLARSRDGLASGI
jgi:hypothetical protein